MTEIRQDVVDALLSARWPAGDLVTTLSRRTAPYVVDSLEAAGVLPRLVEDPAELEALPQESLVLGRWTPGPDGPRPYRRIGYGLLQRVGASNGVSAYRFEFPVTVLWVPATAAVEGDGDA